MFPTTPVSAEHLLRIETCGSCPKRDLLRKHIHGHLCNKETVSVSLRIITDLLGGDPGHPVKTFKNT